MAGARSPLFDWLWSRFDVYGEQMQARGFDWSPMVARLGAEGVTDGSGNPPTLKTIKATFGRVKRLRNGDKTKRRAVKAKPEIRRTFHRSAA